MNVNALENFFSRFGRELRHGKLQIAHADAAQPGEAPVDGKARQPASRRANPRGMRQTAGYGSNQPVFQSFLHR